MLADLAVLYFAPSGLRSGTEPVPKRLSRKAGPARYKLSANATETDLGYRRAGAQEGAATTNTGVHW